MNVVTLGKWSLGALDAIALISLYATTEIRIEAGMLVLAVFLIRALGVRMRSLGLQFGLVLFIVLASIFVALKFHIFPIIVAAHVGALVHALLWLGQDSVRDRVLRLSMGFVNLSLASALTSDFYLFGSIFVFAILGSVYVSLGFLESTFRARVPEQLDQPLPPGYLKNMFYVSFSVFVISVLLFPVIPRASWKRDEGSSYFNVGYTDTVDLLAGAQGNLVPSKRVALRVYSLTPEILEDPMGAIFKGMLKGQALDLFDGSRWLPRVSRSQRELKAVSKPSVFQNARFEVIREAHVKNITFLPYGTGALDNAKSSGRSTYQYEVASVDRQEEPDDTDLAVPQKIRSKRIEDLVRSLFGQNSDNSGKARALQEFYLKGFSGSLVSSQHEHSTLAALETFLFKTKSGNCELFAGSAALLLRMARVPARVIAGYRVSRSSSAGQLTVLDSDAHAWVEYWNDSLGWVPFDPTPKTLVIADWWDNVQQAYWVAQGVWYRWLVGFKKDETTSESEAAAPQNLASADQSWSFLWGGRFFGGKDSWLTVFGLLLAALLGARLFVGFLSPHELKQLLRSGASWSRRRLYFEYFRFQRSSRRARRSTSQADEVSKQWQALYLALRFGPPKSGEEFARDLRVLGDLRRQYSKALS